MSRSITVEIACRAPGLISDTVRIVTAGDEMSIPVSARVLAAGGEAGRSSPGTMMAELLAATGSGQAAEEAAADNLAQARPAFGVRQVQ